MEFNSGIKGYSVLAKSKQEIINIFNSLDDFRDDSKVLYPINEILFLVVSAVLLGNEGWRAIATYGKEKIDFLKNFFPYLAGVPAKSTIQSVMSAFDSKKFETLLNEWGSYVNVVGEQIAIDGKCLRGARSPEDPMYLLNAFATGQGLLIGQEAIGSKTNEITAIPELIDKMNITGATVSVDAIGCQKKIAAKIIEKKGDYFLALKENQANLYNDVKDFFETRTEKVLKTGHKSLQSCEAFDKGHGRVEVRRCYSSDDTAWLNKNNPNWTNLNSICCIESERHINGEVSIERRFFISSTQSNAKKHLSYSRNHWAIENNLHWALDVIYNEDKCQVKKKAAINMGTVRKFILNLVKKFKTKTEDKTGTPILRMRAARNDDLAAEVLMGLAT